jgi:hypothetical protein
MDNLAPRRMLEIHRQRFLVARLHIPPQRGAFVEFAPFAQGVATVGRFDLDHLGAEFGEDARGERAGNQAAEFDDRQTGQWFVRWDS